MNQIDLYHDDEESSNNECPGIFLQKINQPIQIQHLNEDKSKINELIYDNNFKKEFNKILQKKIFKLIKPNAEEQILINFKENNEKYFPFTPGIGLEKSLKKLGYLIEYISPFEINLSSMDNEDKNINQIKFTVIDYSKNEKGKIKKFKKKRKYRPDDIRKE